nr:hypothetical protein Cry52Nrm2_p020 [Cryptomonas curvata]
MSFFYRTKQMRLNTRNLIRNNFKIYSNWILLSLIEYCNNNYVISEKIFFFAVYFFQINSYINIEYNKTKFPLIESIKLNLLKNNIFLKNIWLQLLFETKESKIKKILITNILFYLPSKILIWKLATLYYGFNFLVSIKNKNYCFSRKEIWMRLSLIKKNFHMIPYKMKTYVFNYVNFRYTYISSWFNNLIGKQSRKIESFSFTLNFYNNFFKINKILEHFIFKKRKWSIYIFTRFTRNYFDLDFLINKIILSNIKINNNYDIYISINFIFIGIFSIDLRLNALNINKSKIVNFFILNEFTLNYYPRVKNIEYQRIKIKNFPKYYLVCIFKFLKIKFNYASLCKKFEIAQLSYINKTLLSNFNLQGFYEKTKEFTELIINKKKINKKFLNYNYSKNFYKIKFILQEYSIFKFKNNNSHFFFFGSFRQNSFKIIKFITTVYFEEYSGQKLKTYLILIYKIINLIFFINFFSNSNKLIKMNQNTLCFVYLVYIKEKKQNFKKLKIILNYF